MNRRAAMALTALVFAASPARAVDPVLLITDCDREYYAHLVGETAHLLPDLPPGLESKPRVSMDHAWAKTAGELRRLCVADATAHPDIARLARAAGDLAEINGDPADARAWYQRGADLDDPVSMTMLYWQDRADPEAAHAWVERAAAKDYALAVYLLASDYENNFGISGKRNRSRDEYRRAADLGWWQAAQRLAMDAAATDPDAADRWWDRALELTDRADSRAEILVGHMEAVGPRDPDRGAALLIEALQTGQPLGFEWIAVKRRDPLMARMVFPLEEFLVAGGWLKGTADFIPDNDTWDAVETYRASLLPK